MKQIGLYLHLPFCIQKCRYCDFSSWAGREDLKTPYINALLSELEFYKAEQNDIKVAQFSWVGYSHPFDGEILVQILEKCKEVFIYKRMLKYL